MFSLNNEKGGNFYFRVYDSQLNSPSGDRSTNWSWTCTTTGLYYVKVWEGSSHTGSYDFSIDGKIVTPNSSPEITVNGPILVTMDEDGSPTAWNKPTLTATDPDGDVLTWSLSREPAYGTAEVGGTGEAPTTFNYTPDPDFFGDDSFTVQVSDEGGLADAIMVAVTIRPVNDAPGFSKGNDLTMLEDTGLQTIVGWATGISAGPATESGQSVEFNVVLNRPELFSAGPTIDPVGNLTCKPAVDANGMATVTVALKDNGGTDNGGIDTSAIQTFRITLIPVNDAPVFTKGADQIVFADAVERTVKGWAGDISAGPADETSQELMFLITLDSPELFVEGPLIDPSGKLTYTPASGTSGTATLSVVLTDNAGTDNGGIDTSDTATFTITISDEFADIAVVKTVDNPEAGIGEDVTFTIVATNNGPGDATGVVLLDLLPTGLTYAWDDSMGSYDPETGIWEIGDMANGECKTLVVMATVVKRGRITNTAEVTVSTPLDPDLENNLDTAVIFRKMAMPWIPLLLLEGE